MNPNGGRAVNDTIAQNAAHAKATSDAAQLQGTLAALVVAVQTLTARVDALTARLDAALALDANTRDLPE